MANSWLPREKLYNHTYSAPSKFPSNSFLRKIMQNSPALFLKNMLNDFIYYLVEPDRRDDIRVRLHALVDSLNECHAGQLFTALNADRKKIETFIQYCLSCNLPEPVAIAAAFRQVARPVIPVPDPPGEITNRSFRPGSLRR